MTRLLLFIFLSIGFVSTAQKVTVDATQSGNEVQIKVTIPKGWHIYSMDSNPNFGPIPTSITFEKNENVELVEKVKEPKPIEKYDENFRADLKYFDNEVVFVQKIKIKGATTLKGSINYMMCNKEKCLPPVDAEFNINLKQ